MLGLGSDSGAAASAGFFLRRRRRFLLLFGAASSDSLAELAVVLDGALSSLAVDSVSGFAGAAGAGCPTGVDKAPLSPVPSGADGAGASGAASVGAGGVSGAMRAVAAGRISRIAARANARREGSRGAGRDKSARVFASARLVLPSMSRLAGFLGSALVLSLLSLCAGALADSARLPTPYADRPLTLPAPMLRFDAGPKWPFPPYRVGHLMVSDGEGSDTEVSLNPGMTFGIVDDFELGFVVPVEVAPDVDLHDPVVHLTYRFADGNVEAGLSVAAPIPIEGEFVAYVGIPLRVHGGVIALDFGPFVALDPDPPDESASFIFPLELAIQPTDAFFLGPEVAIVLPQFDGVDIPAGFFLGYTIADATGTLGDLIGRARFFTLDDDVYYWQLMASFELFFDL